MATGRNRLASAPCTVVPAVFMSNAFSFRTVAARSLERLLLKAPFQEKSQFTDNDFYEHLYSCTFRMEDTPLPTPSTALLPPRL